VGGIVIVSPCGFGVGVAAPPSTGTLACPVTGRTTVPLNLHRKTLNQLPLMAVRVVSSIFVGASCRKR